MKKYFSRALRNNILYVFFDTPDSDVNVFTEESLDQLEAHLDLSLSFRAIVFCSKKKSFIAGADIKQIANAHEADDQRIKEIVSKGHNLFNRIEDLEIPTLAVINGAAMGGGLELALACSGRIAVNDSSVQISLPETKLGILPAWGGTTRLPRLIGADNAIDLICSGRSIRPKDALSMGLVDSLLDLNTTTPFHKLSCEEVADLVEGSIPALETELEQRRRQKCSPLKLNMIESMMTFKLAKSMVAKKAGGNYPAPLKALSVIEECRNKCRDEALEEEKRAFCELVKTPASKSLIEIFFGERKLKATAQELASKASMPQSVGVLGAGTMGAGIALALANKANLPVILYDISEEQLHSAIWSAKSYLDSKISKGYITSDEASHVLSLIKTTTDVNEATSKPDLIIEAVPEVMELKRDLVYNCDSSKFVATNTSTFKVDDIAGYSTFGGMHFFNPVSKMPLVEIVAGEYTSDETIGVLCKVALAMGKTPLVCKDCSGFVVNRLLMPYLIEFDKMVSEGHDFEHIDKVMKSYGWPMGPAELCDLVGLDIIHHGSQSMAQSYDHVDMADESPCEALYKKQALGQKTQAGFYSWSGTKRKGKFADSGTVKEVPPIIEERLMAPMKEEAGRLLEEQIVSHPYEINMALVFGAGFPPFKGGLIHAEEFLNS
jgi:3-hydroxyacyl-CoA dehydrogenase/enoyl-CoA hydratase/3-hydroxybutyryl-CoA epimerase/enoyl-CoA isomerase